MPQPPPGLVIFHPPGCDFHPDLSAVGGPHPPLPPKEKKHDSRQHHSFPERGNKKEVWLLINHSCGCHAVLFACRPYFVHRDDLEIISPLWKYYSLKIKEWCGLLRP